MNRFLENLAVRLLNPAAAIQPRTPSRFEPEAAAAPRSSSAPGAVSASETVWEEAVGPEQGRPRPALSQTAPAGSFRPSTLSEDTPATPPTPAQAVRPAILTDASRLALAPLPQDLTRDEAGPNAPHQAAVSAFLIVPARQTVGAEPSVGMEPPGKPLTATNSSVAEMRVAPALVPPPALSAVKRAGGQAQAGPLDMIPAPPGGHAPLPPAASPRLARAPASAEGAVSPGSVVFAAIVTAESGGDPASPERPERPPTPVAVRALPILLPSSAKPSAPTARETPPVPTIQVTIGRIEVRAAPAPRASNARPAPAKLTLEEYLRDGGRK